jgi:hypothetical protein
MLHTRNPQPLFAAHAAWTVARVGDSLHIAGLPGMACRIVRSPNRRGMSR